jgi:hypothetical protein
VGFEVQGSVVIAPDGRANFLNVVFEYTRAMALMLVKVRGLTCESEGRALSLGLGAGLCLFVFVLFRVLFSGLLLVTQAQWLALCTQACSAFM